MRRKYAKFFKEAPPSDSWLSIDNYFDIRMKLYQRFYNLQLTIEYDDGEEVKE